MDSLQTKYNSNNINMMPNEKNFQSVLTYSFFIKAIVFCLITSEVCAFSVELTQKQIDTFIDNSEFTANQINNKL